jgi:hypothetical protein
MIGNVFKTIWYGIISLVFLWFIYVMFAAILATFIPSLLKYFP